MEPETIDISKLDKAEVFKALFDNARPQGLGFLHYIPEPMNIEDAREVVKAQLSFDYFEGRVMKVNISGNQLDPRLYDRDNGKGAAKRVLTPLLAIITTTE